MFNTHRLIGSSLFLLFLFGITLAQENRAPIDKSQEPLPAGPVVTATATAKRVRFVSPGTVVQLRLEVYNEAGQKLFDTELHGGNVLDWHLQDGAGERLPSGSYACLLTSKSLSGRLSRRVGLVTVNGKKAAVEAAPGDQLSQLSLAQQQTIGPVEGNAAFTVLQQSEAEAITAVTHDGTDGQMSRTRGALSFRVGDFFSGKDKEQVRLTEDGRLGIGTSDPQAKLDVAGTIRAERVLIARPVKPGSPGSIDQTESARAEDSAGPEQPLASGSGTQNRIAKWTDNAGALGDSSIYGDSSGYVGIGTTSPGALLTVSKNPTALQAPPPLTVMQLGNADGSATRLNLDGYVAPGQLIFRRANTTAASPSALQSGDLIGRFGGWGYGATGYGPFTTANIDFSADQNWTDSAQGSRITFSTTANGSPSFPVERMRVDSAGNIGIGTTNPQAKLDVSGNINTSTQYNIGGSRVLSNAGTANVFVGVGAGAVNTGESNSFFGSSAGLANTTGFNNSFFGSQAGALNTTGTSNSLFGNSAGKSNTSGGANSFFGAVAGFSNTEGADNSFFGARSGFYNTTGAGNSFFGKDAGHRTTSGARNAFFGTLSGESNTTGEENSFFGHSAGQSNTDADFNSFFGSMAGQLNTTGNANAFFGNFAGTASNAHFNAFFGALAGAANTSGGSNTFVGKGAGASNTTGDKNTYIGMGADGSAGLVNATAIGANAVATTSDTMVLGTDVVTVKIPGSLNVSGTFGGSVNVTTQYNIGGNRVLSNAGTGNLFVGKDAGAANPTGVGNTFVGSNAGKANLAGDDNAFFGASAGLSNTANNNSFFGSNSGSTNTIGHNNSFFGRSAGSGNTEGASNSFFGSNSGTANTTGSFNTHVGRSAGPLNTAASDNTLIGALTGSVNTGSGNTFVGKAAGDNNTSGSSNTYIGFSADGSPAVTNATAIGTNANVTASNSLVLGSINGINGATANTKVGIGTTAPSERLTVQTATSSYGMIHTDGTITIGTYVGGAGNGGYFGTKSNHPLHFIANDSGPRMTVDSAGKVGIGTTTPKAKLEVTGGDILVDTADKGIILKAPNGTTCAKLTLSNAGALVVTPVAPCPL